MDWTPILTAGIPSALALIGIGMQVWRERKNDAELADKARAEQVLAEAQAADTLSDAAAKIVTRYERIIERMEVDHRRELEQVRRDTMRHQS